MGLWQAPTCGAQSPAALGQNVLLRVPITMEFVRERMTQAGPLFDAAKAGFPDDPQRLQPRKVPEA
jgi:hypothetical protein